LSGGEIDDAYQYVAAERYDLAVVSFDGDFDRTERGRLGIDLAELGMNEK
jgi:predicted nucleic acid-binding protein